MSQWDKVHVQVEPATALSLLDAGPDLTTHKEFIRRATTELSESLSYSWEKISGPGNVLFGDASAQETSIAADQDGFYEIRVTARNEWGDETADSFRLTWDTTGPNAPTGLKTLAGSLSGSDVRITNQTTIILSWDAAVDAGSGLRDYDLTWYAGANCSGFETRVPALTATHYTITGQDGDTFSFKVTARDQLDQATSSACSPSVTIDTSLPPALTAFTGVTGAVVGSVKLTLTLPADYSEYASIRVRRSAGITAPVDCSSGTLAKTFAKSDLAATLNYTDLTPTADDAYSYRVCIADEAGNELGQNTTVNHRSKAHYVFASSSTMDGTFFGISGVAAADMECRSLVLSPTALNVVKEELHWKAIVSSSTESALARIQILGKVYATDDPVYTLAANDSTDFWDGSHEALGFFANDEFGAAVGAEMIWTGTLSNGLPAAQNCNNWTTNGGGFAVVGDPGFSDTNWIDNGSPEACNASHRIYCINQRTN